MDKFSKKNLETMTQIEKKKLHAILSQIDSTTLASSQKKEQNIDDHFTLILHSDLERLTLKNFDPDTLVSCLSTVRFQKKFTIC
jgi:BMFP domain-containing protein YqiC